MAGHSKWANIQHRKGKQDKLRSKMFSKLAKDQLGRHQIERIGVGAERSYQTKPYEFGDPFTLHSERTIRNAVARTGGGTPVALSPEDFEIEQTESTTRSATVLMIDLSLSMPMRDNFLPAKKVAMALHSLTVGAPAGDDLEWNVVLVPGFDRSHEIAEIKLPDLNTADIAQAVLQVEGTARSMGLRVV